MDIAAAAGSIVQHYAYSSFGKLIKISNSSGDDITAAPIVKTSYGFTNREHDKESGMMYYRARYYMPEIGRFIQEDPHPGVLNLPITSNNKYIYTVNNPVNLTDPKGEFAFTTILIISAVSSAVTTAISGGDFGDFLKSFVLNEAILSGASYLAAGGFAGAGAGGTALSTNAAIATGIVKGLKSAALEIGINTIHRNLGKKEREIFNGVAAFTLFVYGNASDGADGDLLTSALEEELVGPSQVPDIVDIAK